MLIEIFLQNLLKTFIAIDPISLIPIFATFTLGLNQRDIIKLTFLVFTISSSVLIFFTLYGSHFLLFMNISLSSFQIAGGLFLLFISFEMVFEKRLERKKKITSNIENEKQINNLAVFPISIPLVVGPSAITLSVLISKDFEYKLVNLLTNILPIFLILLFTSILIFFSNYIFGKLNKTLIKILQKIFGLILGAMSVEFIISGLKEIF
ncbi:MAG: antibiotic resistance protein MarC [Rickettsiales bacterium]|nr:antibiotic resistance protein MarC [Rickettsiales bacterium]|tara:strand:+ start:6183 stop:6806 length:624 start_codon:yes stop_codon:yes gene_type:complete